LKRTTRFLALFLVLIFSLLLFQTPIIAQSEDPEQVNIYFFWGEGCPHCEEEKPFLDSLIQKYPRANLIDYEVWYNADNQTIFQQFADTLGFNASGVPVTIIGDKHWIGYLESLNPEIEAALQDCLNGLCDTDVGEIVSSQPVGTSQPQEVQPTQAPGNAIDIPLFGKIDLDKQSLLISTAVIGFVDGFNPCSLWVLSILLALTLHSGSRTKILVVGLTFLLVTSVVYGLFIAGVFTLLSYIGYLKWIQIGIAFIALVFGIVNIKDYFWYKEGVSFTISDKRKPKMYQNMRSAVVNPRTIIGLIGSSAALAVGVSFIEFSCTAGFPVIWSNLMVANNVSKTNFILLLALYMLIYLIDELVIFAIAAITMRASKMEEKHGRLLKLVSGIIMFILGLVMVIDPAVMNNINSSLLVFLLALLIVWFVYMLHQKLLPKFGVYIGTGFKKPKKKRRH
jgi:thiol-disulfide isomerase/thioredoxin